MWKLISYSEIKLPLQPYLSEYIIGIVENENGERSVTRIDDKYFKKISIGAEGKIEKSMGPLGEINLFTPSTQILEPEEDSITLKETEKVGVVGTGVMGTQIAQFILQHGFSVILKSRSKESLDKALKQIENGLSKNTTTEEKNEILRNIKLTTDFTDLSNADFVIECVSEDEKSKEEVFRQLDNVCSKETVLATNTSSLSVGNLANIVSNPRRVIGIHFFNPVEKMRLIEVVRGTNTSKETIDIAKILVKKLDKTPIVVYDRPGFIVNRILFSMINEAGYVLEEGKSSIEEIDTAMKLGTKFPMGPFELADFIGIDVTYEIIRKLSLSIPNFKTPSIVFAEMIKSGKLGRKTKEGFYKY